MRVLMRCVELIGAPEQPDKGKWLMSFDPNGNDGFGAIVWTDMKEAAKVFDSTSDALEFWAQRSTVRPDRDDGRPNKPLTAYTVSLEMEAAEYRGQAWMQADKRQVVT